MGKVARTPGSVDQPGGEVRFTVGVVNRTQAVVTLTALVDDVFGNLDQDSAAASHTWTASDCQAGVPLAAYNGSVGGEDTYTCSFVGSVTGAAGTTHEDTVTATITDASGEKASEKATATVEIVDCFVQPSIAVTKTATPSVVQDSGLVTFTAVVTNTSPVDALVVDQLTDSIHGDLIRGPIKATCTYGGTAVTLPRSLPVGESFICTFRATVSVSETDIVSASGIDPERNRVADAAEALVTVLVTPTPEPPPPQPPPETPPPEPNPEPSPPNVHLSLRKTAPATAFLDANGRGSFVYEIRGSTHRLRTKRDHDGQRTQGHEVHEDHRPAGTRRVLDQPCGQAAYVLRLPRRRTVVRDEGPRVRDGPRRDDNQEHGLRCV